MEKEKKIRNLKTFLNPFSGGVSKMKPFRITVVLLALLVLPLFATQALAADFFVPLYDVPNDLVGANTVNQPVIGFILEHLSGETLDKVTVRSYIQHFYATEKVKLWREDGTTPGFQVGEDDLWKTYVTSGIEFDINDEITFLSINKVLPTDDEVFYITLDINTTKVNASPGEYHGTGLDVTLPEGYIVLKNGDANNNDVVNPGWVGPPEPSYAPYTLYFDTEGPDFDLQFCIEDNTCSTYTYYGSGWTRLLNVDQEDSVRICAHNVEGDIDSSEGIHVIGWVHLLGHVSSEHMFGVANVMLRCPDVESGGCSAGEKNGCDTCWTTGFRIPDKRNTGGFHGVDADSGHWAICAWAEDTVGNRDTVCIEHDKLAYRIDTKKPIIDEVSWEFTPKGDLNGDGKIGLGDSIMIIGKGLSNPIDPLKECVQMRVDTSWMAGNSPSYPNGEWAELSDTLQENNRIFRRVFCLTNPLPIDSSGGCPVNFLVEAWDNACNYDTSRGKICADMDLDPPSVSVLYEWKADLDTMWGCMGLGDSVLIRAFVGGFDINSVTAMMDSAGIDELMRHALPLPNRGSGVYDTIWAITEPPIIYGKDADNTQPPPVDNDYSMWVIACDDVGNCDTAYGDLNKTLDTRRPRPIGYAQFCPDSVPCALTAQSLAGGMIALAWDTACDENDAYAFYVWALHPDSTEYDSIGYTAVDEQPISAKYWSWHSEPLEEGYWRFKIKTEDNCSNVGDFSCVVGAYADATPPHVCIAVPDSGLTFGSWFPLKAVADSESHDVESACLWYRLRPDKNDPPLGEAGPWTKCLSDPYMYRPGDGYVFTDSVHCLEGVDYIGWVEMIVMACDEVGNCQDTSMAFDDACLVDDDVFRPAHFLFYWDTLAPALHLVSVNGFPSPQSACGFDVDPSIMNEVVIDVDGAEEGELFEVDVRAIHKGPLYRIFHQDSCAMPCTIWVSVEGWDEGTQSLYINVKDYDNDRDADLQVELCVPPTAPENCIYISKPVEWQRIPCTGTSGHHCVPITAEMYEYAHCDGVDFTEVRFQWSHNGIDSWETIEDVIGSGPSWSTCWDNTNEVEHGDTVYFRVIAHDEFYMADTSYMVKVFVDCESPNVTLRIEDLYYTCGNEIPKVPCAPLILKAVLGDTLIDLYDVVFRVKRHSDPDLVAYWHKIGEAGPAWSDNIWKYDWDEPCCEDDVGFGDGFGGGPPPPRACMYPNDYWDIRICARDQVWNVMFDYDNDRRFDDSTFNDAVAVGAGITVFVDDEAPIPAISMVCDQGHEPPICIVNPSGFLGGTGEAYVQAGHDITAEISVLPSEDTCEVMKVHWYLKIEGSWVHVGTSFYDSLVSPNHYPVTFNTDGLIPPYELEDGWWSSSLMAELHDSLGNISSDEITLYILDITPTQALITSPLNESYVWGNVPLRAMALNAYDICKLCYEYRPEADSVWYPVNGGYPNACITVQEGGEPITAPGMTLMGGNPGDDCSNPIPIYIPGDLPFHDFAQTTCGRGDYDNDGCLNAWDGAEDIYYRLEVTQSVDLDIMLYPHSTEKTGMAIGSECKLHGYCEYKSTIYGASPHGWTSVHLNPGTYYLQIDGRWDGPSCIPNFNLSIIQHGFPLEWLTLNTVADGAYYLRAVATDCSNNEDEDPHTIRVTVANELPTAVLEDPRICERPCANNPEDTLGYVGGTVALYATGDSEIPLDRIEFYYKSIFGYPNTYTLIDTDYFPTGGKYSVQWNTKSLDDGRYHVKVRVYNAAGRYGDSEPITITVDNSPPFVDIISFNGNDYYPGDVVNISPYDTLAIEVVAIDSTSNDGWTRCYNSGVTMLGFCVTDGPLLHEGDPPLSELNWYTDFHDGDTLIYWNVSGLAPGTYYVYVLAKDCLGNWEWDEVEMRVYDNEPPLVTIGAFFHNPCTDQHFVYGYTCMASEDDIPVWAKFEYRMIDGADTSAWLGVGEADWYSEFDGQSTKHCFYEECTCCYNDFLQFVWDPSASLLEGVDYQGRIFATDYWGNTSQDYPETHSPIVNFTYEDGVIVPQAGPLGPLSFEKNFDVGRMHGIVRQTSDEGLTPQVFGVYLPDWGCGDSEIECVWMQQNLNYSTHFAGSFEAGKIWDGGSGTFFSSVTLAEDGIDPLVTGEGQLYTYLRSGDIMAVKVDKDLGTYTQYCTDEGVCVYVPGGAVSSDKHLVVWPEELPPVSLYQPTWIPVGDDNGFATYVGFTEDCNPLKDCCFKNGRYATIKINYSSDLDVPAESLVVAWWSNSEGKWKTDSIYYPPVVEGFNTDGHYVEFAAKCLWGPFAVIHIMDMPCTGPLHIDSLMVSPSCNGYTGTTPKFTARIADDFSGVDESSIMFKMAPVGQPFIPIYDGSKSGCDRWAWGFGNFYMSGYDNLSNWFRVGWSERNSSWPCYDSEHRDPADPLGAGDYVARWTAMNNNLNSCTRQLPFVVDATPPVAFFEEKCLSRDPEFDVIIIDRESGVNKDSVWIYTSYSNYELSPDQLGPMWVDDTTIHVELPLDISSSTDLYVYVYEGTKYGNLDPNLEHGPVDMVGNKATSFWHRYRVDVTDPTITLKKKSYRFRRPVLFDVYDDYQGCGIYSITIDECTNPTGGCTQAPAESVVYDPQTEILRYYPPASGAWIQVTVKDSAHNTTFLDSIYCVEDYDPPMVSFVQGYNGKYVGSDPTIKFVVTDGVAGVDWESVNAEINGCSNKCTFPWTEVLNHMENDTVTLSCPLKCSDNSSFTVCVYSDYTYGKGPADKGDNHIKNAPIWTYYVDAAGPSITLKTPSDSLCKRPLLFEIKDTKSGLYAISVYEDSSLVTEDTTLTLDPHMPNIWRYYPSTGTNRLDLVAVDSLGNETHYGTYIKDDCTAPVVTFLPSWINCTDPTVTFLVSDAGSGVDWSTVNVDLYYSADRIQTFGPSDFTHSGDTVTVTGNNDLLGLKDNWGLNVVVYSQKNYETSYTRGPADLASNYQTSTSYYKEVYYADCVGPTITWKSGADSCTRPLEFEIKDSRSGIATIAITEDGTPFTDFSYNDTTKMLSYSPSAGGLDVVITATDNVDNATTYSFISKDDCEAPVVTFLPGYVRCDNVTISFTVTDAGTGVDWSTLSLDLYYSNYVLTFTPDQIDSVKSGDTVTVTVTGDDALYLQLSNNATLYAVVYSEKNYGTSYTKGPQDLAGNYYTSTNYFKQAYYADCTAPSISWKNSSDPCDRPIKLEITDSKSGVAEVHVYEDGVEYDEALFYNSTTQLWEYTPAAGIHELDVMATDVAGNSNTETYKVKDDCQGPAVSFASGYVTKNPTIKFTVADPSGVDWSTVNARVSGCGEECDYAAPALRDHVNFETGEVTLDGCNLDCSDGNEVEVWVYSGTSYTGQGPADETGNYLPKYAKCSFVVDAKAPYLVSSVVTSNRPIEIKVADDRSGIDWSTLKFYEDSLLICDGLECTDDVVSIDTDQGVIEYTPDAGRLYIQIHLWDYAGNMMVKTFYTEAEVLVLTKPHNYPNPFDPREEATHIVLGINKTSNVTVKIYDFAGEYVRTVGQPNHVASLSNDELIWDGTTDDGTKVANGTYLCYIKARDNNGSTKTAVIKITVIKQDK